MKKLIAILTCLAITTTFTFAGSCEKKCGSKKKAESAECEKKEPEGEKSACGGSKSKDKDTEKSEDQA